MATHDRRRERRMFQELYQHIAFPRDVPGNEDGDLLGNEAALLARLTDAARDLASYVPVTDRKAVDGLAASLVACQAIHVKGTITKPVLVRELRSLQAGKCIILHVRTQNCGLLIQRTSNEKDEPQIIFEAFEVTPPCEKVLATENALVRDFPGCAISLPLSAINEPSFADSLTGMLQQASTERLHKFSTITFKAAAPLPEIRDTSDPSIITGLLMTILEANGSSADVQVLQKRVRDTVMFDQAYKPWRRSPLYLTLRVGIQRHLYMHFGHIVGRLYYKTMMCLMIRQFLEEALKVIPFESVSFLHQKLGRRLAKLSSDRAAFSQNIKPTRVSALSGIDIIFETTVKTTGAWLMNAWRYYNNKRDRTIPMLSTLVPPGAFEVYLSNAQPTLHRVFLDQGMRFDNTRCPPEQFLLKYEKSATSVKPYMHAARAHMQLRDYRATVDDILKDEKELDHTRIIELSKVIETYVNQIQNAPGDQLDEKSEMLLHLMELWVSMDKAGVTCYPLLQDYHSGFGDDLLDPIELLSLHDMSRAKGVRDYLATRCHARRGVQSRTIFDDISDDCFAARYFEEYDEEGHDLRREIEIEAAAQIDQKELDWQEQSQKYTDTIIKRDQTACHYDEVPSGRIPGDTETIHRQPCRWHDLNTDARKMRIRIFEGPLPSWEPAAKAAMFEIRCPESFAAYRNATWTILSVICTQQPIDKPARVSLLQDYPPLKNRVQKITPGVTLASEKKAFIETHYAEWGFPVDLDTLIRTCGFKLRYYDRASRSWTAQQTNATLWHHFPVMLAPGSPFSAFHLSYATWPSSNEIQASQADCPSGVGVHEMLAWQGLLVGTHSRWLDLTRELGSSDMNFSADHTWVIISRLVSQIGPSAKNSDARGHIHSALLDETLCRRLLQLVKQRLDAIRHNWRELIQMDMMISIILKVQSMSMSDGIHQQASDLLLQARESTDLWRLDLQRAVTDDASIRPFAIWAALLCKRTLHLHPETLMEPDSLQHYIGASVSLNYNLVDDFKSLPWTIRTAIIRDVMFSYEHRGTLLRSVLSNADAFIEAVNRLWHISQGYESRISASLTGTWWVVLELKYVAGDHTESHFVHYNYVHGTLLIDGQEMSTLPPAYRQDPLYRAIFGNRNPIVFPSPLRGMSWAISEPLRNGQRLHLGFRQQTLVVRAVQNDEIHEFIPAEVFGPGDLPAPLISDCYHWLNVRTGDLEIREQDMWSSRPRNWWIYGIPSGRCQIVRNRGNQRRTTLLNSSNVTTRCINNIFGAFEERNQIMIFASLDGRITVELKVLDLSFFINAGGILQSNRLNAIIPQHQDVGTWHGLRSKLVIQSLANRRQRSILVPYNSEIKTTRDGIHVAVTVNTGGGQYLKYDINETLGRLDCPPEPALLYMKALLHALTSQVVPDRLTSRTGVEESVRLLRLGLYLPWSPLGVTHIRLLHRLADLSPKRGYYPRDLKAMETLKWDADLTRHIQDDRFRSLVESILKRHYNLCEFITGSLKHTQEQSERIVSDAHLAKRALARTFMHSTRQDDLLYIGRDRRMPSLARANTFSIVSQLLLQQLSPINSPSLVDLLHDAPLIGGYDLCFQKVLLSDLLSVDMKAEWGALTQRAMQCNNQDRFRLMFLLGAIAYSDDANLDLLSKLVSIVLCADIRSAEPPLRALYFHFRADGAPPVSYLVSLMEKAQMPFNATGFKKRSHAVVAENNHDSLVKASCEALARSIRDQWPQTEIDPTRLTDIDCQHINIDQALEDVKSEWQRLTRNHELALYLERIQNLLDEASARQEVPTEMSIKSSSLHPSNYSKPKFATRYPSRSRDRDDLSLQRLLKLPIGECDLRHQSAFNVDAPHVPRILDVTNTQKAVPMSAYAKPLKVPGSRQDAELEKLRAIVGKLGSKTSHVYAQYAKEMEASIGALGAHLQRQQETSPLSTRQIDNHDLQPARQSIGLIVDSIQFALAKSDPQSKWLRLVGLWPRMTIIDLLAAIRATSDSRLEIVMKRAIVSLGVAVTKLQRLLRLQDAQKRQKIQQQRDEWANSGHTNWDPFEYPDWLLLEIDGDVMLREEQVQVAFATINPAAGGNSVLQLLMGKGKTSCILPMVAAVLANKQRLTRVVVPRPLLLQTAQILHVKLGNLVNRQIMHIPFSRKTSANLQLVGLYRQLHVGMCSTGGIMITLPEHLLSFKLSGIQQLADNHIEVAKAMVHTQDWLDKQARDVLDECDVSLAIRMQLIYPSGSQTSVDGHPTRWQLIELLLSRTQNFITAVRARFVSSVQLVQRAEGGFPLIYFSRKDAEDHLIELLVADICKGNCQFLPCAEFSQTVLEDISSYISKASMRPELFRRITTIFKDRPRLMKVVNLLRGLFACRILISSLKKRWNVQYGLHPARAPIAVPYLAKGVPSVAAEWGHPDVAIILTALSFYYQGLSPSQFKQTFEQLGKIDDPTAEYAKWIPQSAHFEVEEYSAINVEDGWQLNRLFRLIRLNGSLINFYLNNFVFPRYAKTFSVKLQASGWNLFSVQALEADEPMQSDVVHVTGFSGTNDTRHQLPMPIKQADIVELAHTNAEVPYYLLSPRNRGYMRMHDNNGRRWTELDLIRHMARTRNHYDYPTRILIDAGAQVLEHSNQDFAKAWLNEDQHALAAVYFDDDNRAWALSRTGKRAPLSASPFADDLNRCVVYLDESHCRGTDLKLPVYGKAALTLGQNLTKDALVQAAMRLRLLGQTQSVTFYSPPEVHQGILDCLNRSEPFLPSSADVLLWVFRQTCDMLHQQEPSYLAQASQYMQQRQARIKFPSFLDNENSRFEFLAAMLQKEALTIKELYQPRSTRRIGFNNPSMWDESLHNDIAKLNLRQNQFQDDGSAVHASALEEVEIEQERELELEVEVEHEVENVREAQRPPRHGAYPIRKLHEDIEHFVEFGRLVAGSSAYQPMFSVLGRTALGLKRGISHSMPSSLWVSEQFSRTVDVHYPIDNYVRQCNWVLWSASSQKAVIISPEEADALLPILRVKGNHDTTVHLIVYAAPVTRRMLHFNDLQYHATPPLPADFEAPTWLTIELGIFSGRLHFEWQEYTEMLRYFVLEQDLTTDPKTPAFAGKPLVFMHEWIDIRRKGQDFEHTPMGFVTTGKPLSGNHAFFETSGGETHAEIRPRIARLGAGSDEKDEDEDSEYQDDEDEDFVADGGLVDDEDLGDEKEHDDGDEEDYFADAQENLL